MELTTEFGPVDRSSRVYVAGHRGLVGAALIRALRRAGFSDVVGLTSAELDLREAAAVEEYIGQIRPSVVMDAAARVGGIAANDAHPADFLSDNLRIQVNLMDAARRVGVPRLLFLGSSCIYPRLAEQPIREDALMTGPLEPTNAAYAVAKIAGIAQVQAVRRQDGLRWISAMPTNLYGPGDNVDPATSHVLPAMLVRFHQAVRSGADTVTCWGTGTPRREFLHVDDLADACLHLLDHYDGDDPVNVGVGRDCSIREVAELVADVVGYRGRIEWDSSAPDGTPRKVLDVRRLAALGWSASIGLRDGIEDTYRWFVERGSSDA